MKYLRKKCFPVCMFPGLHLPNSILKSNVQCDVWRGVFGRELGLDGGAFLSGISALVGRKQRTPTIQGHNRSWLPATQKGPHQNLPILASWSHFFLQSHEKEISVVSKPPSPWYLVIAVWTD